MPDLTKVKGTIYDVDRKVKNQLARLYCFRSKSEDGRGYLGVSIPGVQGGRLTKSWRVESRGADPVIVLSVALVSPLTADLTVKFGAIGYTRNYTKYPYLDVYGVVSRTFTQTEFYDVAEFECERTGEYVAVPVGAPPSGFPLTFPIRLA